LLHGVDSDRLKCCVPGDVPTWYLVTSHSRPSPFLAELGSIPDVDLLLRSGWDSFLFAVRTPEAMAAVRKEVCARIEDPGAIPVWSASYGNWMALLKRARGSNSSPPAEPVRCTAPDTTPFETAPLPAPRTARLDGFLDVFRSAPFDWVRTPRRLADVLEERTVVLSIVRCEDIQARESAIWLDSIEGEQRRRGTAVVTILYPRHPEEREATNGDWLCGYPRGERRILGIALDGALELDMGMSHTPHTFIYDSTGAVREHVDDPVTPGSPTAQRLEEVLAELWAEEAERRPMPPNR